MRAAVVCSMAVLVIALAAFGRALHETAQSTPATQNTAQKSPAPDKPLTIHEAARQGDVAAVRAQLDRGAGVSVQDSNSRHPLHLAAAAGHIEVAKLLLERGADINSFGGWDYWCATPLQLAVLKRQRAMAKLLVDHGADVNACLGGKLAHAPIPALQLAAGSGQKQIVELLLDHGANVNQAGLIGFEGTALYAAVSGRHFAVARLLLARGAKMDVYVAAGMGDVDNLKRLLKADPTLIVGKRRGEGDFVWTDLTPLHWAAMTDSLKAAEFLIQQGADVNAFGGAFWRWGSTPLHVASRRGSLAVARVLLASGAEVNSRNSDNEVPLFGAIGAVKPRMAALLVEHGANIEAKDNDGETPLHAAIRARDWRGKPDGRMVKLLLERGAKVNTKDQWGVTALHVAAERGCSAHVELLLSRGAKINATDKGGRTPLIAALPSGFLSKPKEDPKLIALLLANGADVNAKDNEGHTALSLATQNGFKDVVRLLQEHGATP